MPEMAAPYAYSIEPAGPVATPRLTPSWTKVLMASFALFAIFLFTEHKFTRAGLSIATQDEGEVLDKNTDSAEKGDRVRKGMLLAFAAAGAFLLIVGRTMPWNPHRAGAAILLMLLLWAAMSVGWASFPALSLRRLLAWCCFVVGCLGFARTLTPRELLRVATVTLLVMALMSVAADFAGGAGPWRSDYRLSGTLHPNVQATYCATLCLAGFCLAGDMRFRLLGYSICVFGLTLVVLTGSRTSLVAALLSISAAWLLRQRPIIRAGAVGLVATAVGTILCTFFLLAPSDQRTLTGAALLGRTEKAGTLSGRVPLWYELKGYALDRPIGGYGYDSFWTPGVMEDILESQEWTMTSAHNLYLETVLQLGLVGLALSLAAVTLALWLAKSRFEATKDAAYQFFFALIIYAMLNGCLEAHFLRPKYPTAIALMGVAALILFRQKPEVETEDRSLTAAATRSLAPEVARP